MGYLICTYSESLAFTIGKKYPIYAKGNLYDKDSYRYSLEDNRGSIRYVKLNDYYYNFKIE